MMNHIPIGPILSLAAVGLAGVSDYLGAILFCGGALFLTTAIWAVQELRPNN